MNGGGFRYKVFISYNHADRVWAEWLEQRLEDFATPKEFVGETTPRGPIPPNLNPVYRDRTGQAAAPDLGIAIQEKLVASESLVVICSRSAARNNAATNRNWVDEEVVHFREIGRGDSVFAFIVDGTPNAIDPVDECFPASLRLIEPAAADARAVGDGRDIAVVKLIAGLIGIDPVRLQAKENLLQLRRARNARRIIALLTILTIIAISFGVVSLRERQESLSTQSKFLARMANDISAPNGDFWSGDQVRAVQVALEGAPASKGALLPRPLTHETEWALSAAQVRNQLIKTLPHGASVVSAAYSPDGAKVLTASEDGTARVWDAQTGRELQRFKHTEPVRLAIFSPDGKLVATISDDIYVWDVMTGERLSNMPGGEDQNSNIAFSADSTALIMPATQGASVVDARSGDELVRIENEDERERDTTGVVVAVSPGGKYLAMSFGSKSVGIWNLRTGSETAKLVGHSNQIISISFDHDGRRLITTSADTTARIWDTESGRQVAELRGHEDLIWQAAFSRDDKRIITASKDKTARVWDAQSGKQLFRLSGHGDSVNAVAFAPDGIDVASASSDRTVRLWDSLTGLEIGRLSNYEGRTFAAQFSPDGTRLVSASEGASAQIWDVSRDQALVRIAGTLLAVKRSGHQVLVASGDNSVRIVDSSSGKELHRLEGHSSQVNSGAYSPDGLEVVTGSDDKTAIIWDVATGHIVSRLVGHTLKVSKVLFSPDGTRVLTGSNDQSVRLWGAASGRELMKFKLEGLVEDINFSPDGKRIVTAADNTEGIVWDALAGTVLSRSSKDWNLMSTAFSPNGQEILSRNWGDVTYVWDAASGRELRRLPGPSQGSRASYSVDGTRIATNYDDGNVRIWSGETGRLLAEIQQQETVFDVQFSSDAQRVLTASSDGTARIWDSISGAELVRLVGHTCVVHKNGDFSMRFCGVHAAHFDPEGERVITSGDDGSVRVWNVESAVATVGGSDLIEHSCSMLADRGVPPMPKDLRAKAFLLTAAPACATYGVLDWHFYQEAWCHLTGKYCQ